MSDKFMQIKPTEQESILRLLADDMNIQYEQAQKVRDEDSKSLKSLDYTQYIPYEYRTLDRMALLLTGGDVCNAVCMILPTNQLVVAHNIPKDQTNEQAIREKEIKIRLLKQFMAIAKQKGNKAPITQLQYNDYLKPVIELAKEQDFLAYQRKYPNEKKPESWENYKCKDERYIQYTEKVVHSLCYSDDPVTLNLAKSLRNIKDGEEKASIVAAPGKHAEMNIVDQIKQSFATYVGISKLCCNDCIKKIVERNRDTKNPTKIVVKGSHFHDRDHNQDLYPVKNKENAESSDQEERTNQALQSQCELKMWLFQQDLLELKQEQRQGLQQQLQQQPSQQKQVEKQQQQNEGPRTELDKQIASLQKVQQTLQTMVPQLIEQISAYNKKFIERISNKCKTVISSNIEKLENVSKNSLTANDQVLLAQYIHLLSQDNARNLLSEEQRQTLLTMQQNFPFQGQVLTIPQVPSQQTIGQYTTNESPEQMQSRTDLYNALRPLSEQILTLQKIDKRTEQLQKLSSILNGHNQNQQQFQQHQSQGKPQEEAKQEEVKQNQDKQSQAQQNQQKEQQKSKDPQEKVR